MVRAAVFAAALLLYALLSSPTPDHMGIVEGLIAAGLIAGIGVAGILQAAGVRYDPGSVAPCWILPARLFLIFGLTVPLITGLAQGYAPSWILRDVISFLFLLLPLFLPPSLTDRPSFSRFFPWLLCALGLIFAGRVAIPYLLGNAHGFIPGFMPDPDNLVNAPTVLFSSLFLAGTGGLYLVYARDGRNILIAMVCLALTLILLIAMAGVGQRAHIGAWSLTALVWLGLLAVRQPLALGRMAIVLGLAALFLWPLAADIAQGLAHKNTVVGLNNRLEEARVVWTSFHGRPWALIGGQGWGADIVSPAVGSYPVNYTHSLLTTYFLKTGLLGLGLALAYLGTLGWGLWRVLWVNPVAALALAAPFFIDITLYASFKSLDFGLLLGLIALWTKWTPRSVKVARAPLAGVCRTVIHNEPETRP